MKNYKAIDSCVKTGDILVSYNVDNILSDAIANITKAKWSHVFMYIGHGNIVESIIGENGINGVQITSLKRYYDGKHNIAVLRIKQITEKEAEGLAKDTLKYVGKKYGILQMLWYLFIRLIGKSENPKWQLDVNPNKMVCSEAIAQVCLDKGYEIKPGFHPSGVEPVDFIQSAIFDTVYQLNV